VERSCARSGASNELHARVGPLQIRPPFFILKAFPFLGLVCESLREFLPTGVAAFKSEDRIASRTSSYPSSSEKGTPNVSYLLDCGDRGQRPF
jgi:hypothetical protein